MSRGEVTLLMINGHSNPSVFVDALIVSSPPRSVGLRGPYSLAGHGGAPIGRPSENQRQVEALSTREFDTRRPSVAFVPVHQSRYLRFRYTIRLREEKV